MIKKGKIDIIVNNNYIRTLNKNEGFGERALFFKEKRSASAKANSEDGETEVYILEEKDFNYILEDNLKLFLLRRLYLQDNNIELKDLLYIDKLGTGTYSDFYLVKSVKNKSTYFLKAISKSKINKERIHSNLDTEKKILLKIDHPFIIKLVKTLKDEENVYFLLEYIRGKDLSKILKELGPVNKTKSQFYISSIMLAVTYLHERKIIYRDIKPDNILVSDNVNKVIIQLIIYLITKLLITRAI